MTERHGDFTKAFINQQSHDLPPELEQLFKLVSDRLPEKEKIVEKKKSEHIKTKQNVKIAALKKKRANVLTKYLKTKKDIRTMQLSEKIKRKHDVVKRRALLLEKNVDELMSLLETKDVKPDQNVEAIVETTTNEMIKIKNLIKNLSDKMARKNTGTEMVIEKNIEEMKNQLAAIKENIKRDLQQYEVEKKRESEAELLSLRQTTKVHEENKALAKTKMEMENQLAAIKEEIRAMNQHKVLEKLRIDREILQMREMQKKQLESIKCTLQQYEVEKKREIETELFSLHQTTKVHEENKALVKTKMEMENQLAAIKEEIRAMNQHKVLEKLRIHREILQMREMQKKQLESIKCTLQQYEVEKKREIETELFSLHLKTKNHEENKALMKTKTETNISAMQQHRAEKQRQFEAEIQRMKDFEAQIKYAIEKDIEAMENRFMKCKVEIEDNINAMLQYEAQKKRETEAEIQRMKDIMTQKKSEIEKNINTLIDTLNVNKIEIENNLMAMLQYEAQRKCEVQTEIKRNKGTIN